LLGVRSRVPFLFAEAGAILLATNAAISAKRRIAFTQMDRTNGEGRLS